MVIIEFLMGVIFFFRVLNSMPFGHVPFGLIYYIVKI